MTQSPGVIMTVLSFLLVIGPLVFIHELGHYFAGRACGVKADAFSIGFGREILGWTDKRGTRWKVGWMPFGGYVKFAGDMNPASAPTDDWLMLPPEERAKTFQSKKLWQRFIIVLAGPMANFLFAITVFAAVFSFYGEPRTPAVVSHVLPGSAAEAAGIRPGDRITMIAGQGIQRFEDIADIVSLRPGETLRMDVYRGPTQVHLKVTPGVREEKDRFGNVFRIGMLGISSAERVVVPLQPHEVLTAAVGQTVSSVRMMVDTLVQVITGRRAASELGGPLRIAQFSGQVASIGWFEVVMFMTMISINLGFINLLPVPLLDGGHLFFYAIEAVRRRPLTPATQEWAFRSGLALLLTLMVFVTMNDLGSFGVWQRLAGLIGRS
ncbi:RIP metalloprotease RseP [Flavisphingomonas formosensis]|uniref:RIP metalloprotease RseP n=1 Tax=Flavisphingomonas formosensis TaxID=861534 RepID=UPI0012F8A633